MLPKTTHPINSAAIANCFVSNPEKKPVQLSFKSCWDKPLVVNRYLFRELMVVGCFIPVGFVAFS